MPPALRAEHISKRYRRRPPTSFVDSVGALLGRLRAPKKEEREFWALRDVSLEAEPGEVLGIIGRNGAGKSTLLRILSRITPPTTGSVCFRGRVASLLEVGTGFHSELSGRENIYLSGAILGMRRGEIARKFDSIVEFADLAAFIDSPVKHYSTGMYTRLAFAVGAHLDSDILIVDEVLAVGDVAFQRKCLNKMGEMGRDGRTTLFVSHNLQAVSTLTSRCIVLERGEIRYAGATPDTIAAYLTLVENPAAVFTAPARANEPTLTRVTVVTDWPNQQQQHGGELEIRFRIDTPRPLRQPSLSFQIVSDLGQPATYLWCFDSEMPYPTPSSGALELSCRIPHLRLYQGRYTLTVNFSENAGRDSCLRIENVCPFEVVLHGRHHDFGWHPYACAYIEDAQWRFALTDRV